MTDTELNEAAFEAARVAWLEAWDEASASEERIDGTHCSCGLDGLLDAIDAADRRAEEDEK
jgi:hypothetical protein